MIHAIIHVLSLWQLLIVLAAGLMLISAAAFVLSVLKED